MRNTLRTISMTGALAMGGFLALGADPSQAQNFNGQFGQRGQFAARLGQSQANGNFGQGQYGRNFGQGQPGQAFNQARPGLPFNQGQSGRTFGQAGGNGTSGLGGNSRLGPVYNPAQPYSFQQQLNFRQGVISQYTGRPPQGHLSADQQKAFQAGRQYIQTQHIQTQRPGRAR